MEKRPQPSSRTQLQSSVISFLRFPLIVAVVLIHTQILPTDDLSITIESDTYPAYATISYIVAQIIARIAVPLFFFMSGFLFFYKTDFTAKTYGEKLKKRCHTLLVPYIIWNALFIIVYNISGMLFPGKTDHLIGPGYNLVDWIGTFWGNASNPLPINYPFWFIRDLMVVCVCSPAIYWLIKKWGYALPLIIGGFWIFFSKETLPGISLSAFFFCSLGAYYSIRKRDFTKGVERLTIPLGIIYVILAGAAFLSRNFEWTLYIKDLSIIVGLAFVIGLTAKRISAEKWKANKFLTEGCFFVFAYHGIALPIIRQGLEAFIPFDNDAILCCLYFLWSGIAIAVGLGGHYLLNKFLPKLCVILTGGRGQRKKGE